MERRTRLKGPKTTVFQFVFVQDCICATTMQMLFVTVHNHVVTDLSVENSSWFHMYVFCISCFVKVIVNGGKSVLCFGSVLTEGHSTRVHANYNRGQIMDCQIGWDQN